MGLLENLDKCSCGYRMEKKDNYCPSCHKKRFQVKKLDGSHGKGTLKSNVALPLNKVCDDAIKDFF
jgi:hypothetical protein